jgi:hypothetical protein
LSGCDIIHFDFFWSRDWRIIGTSGIAMVKPRILPREIPMTYIFIYQRGRYDGFRNPLASIPDAFFVTAREDRFGEYRGLSISSIAFKVIPQVSTGILILEKTFNALGGPAVYD